MLAAWGSLGAFLWVDGRVTEQAILTFAVSYILSMALLSPDLDLSRSRASRRWGLLRWLWVPYAIVFRHRQMSHHLILGPLTRVLYLLAIGLALAFVYMVLTRRALQFSIPPLSSILAALLGLYLPNLTHILSDRLHSEWRRRRALRRL